MITNYKTKPHYFNALMTIPELFDFVDFEKVKARVLSLLTTLDGMEPKDIEKIDALIDLTFGDLGEPDYLSNLYSR